MHELAELKKMVYDLESKVKTLEIVMPNWFSLGDVAKDLNKSRDTIRKYLISNFEPEIDFKKNGAKIYISRDTLFFLRKKYEK